jgi:hypothetical protein
MDFPGGAARCMRPRDERRSIEQRRRFGCRGRGHWERRTHRRFKRRPSGGRGRGTIDWRCRARAPRLRESGGGGDCLLGAVCSLRGALQQLVASRECVQQRCVGARSCHPVRSERESRPAVQELVQRRAAHAVLPRRQLGLRRQTRRLSWLRLHAGRRILLLVHLRRGDAGVWLLRLRARSACHAVDGSP